MKRLSIATGLICAALLCGRASAVETDYDAGTQALPLQQAGGTARATAMGSAVVAVPQGSASLLWNPAGLSRMDCTELGLHHNAGLGDTMQETLIFGVPLGRAKGECKGGSSGGLAASLGYVNHGSFDGRDSIGLRTGTYKAADLSGSLGWGMELWRYFSGGIVLKDNRSRFADKTYNAFAADIGFLWAVRNALDLGLTYSNIKLSSNIGKLVSGWRLGAAWTVDKHLLLSASTELQNKAMDRLQLGTEYLVGNVDEKIHVLAMRAGYQVNYPDPQLSGMTNITLGLGYTLSRDLALDYSMAPVGELGTSHRFSLTLKFGCPEKRKAVAVAVAVIMPPPAPAPTREPMPDFVPETIIAPVVPAPVVLKMALLEDSHFDFDQATLRPEGMEALRENVQILKDNPNAQVRVAGYASASGTEEYNQVLSEKRAVAVSMFLIQEGIAPGRITTIGYGEMQPAEYEATPNKIHTEAAKANRRVLLTVPVK